MAIEYGEKTGVINVLTTSKIIATAPERTTLDISISREGNEMISSLDNDLNGYFIRSGYYLSPSINYGQKNTAYGDDFIYERVWIDPLIFELGFIVENSEYEIKVWNAHKDDSVNFTSVTVDYEDGVSLEYGSLPDLIHRINERALTLSVYKDGPAVQNTTYTLTIGGLDYEIEITGLRVIPFDLDLNWNSNPEFTIGFQTTIFTSDKLKEQRRQLSDENWVTISAEFDAIGNSYSRNLNNISYGHDKVIAVPIFIEKLTSSAITQDATEIIVNEDISYYYFLINKVDHIVIIDHVNGLTEVKEVSSIDTGAKKITLSNAIAGDFDESTTYIYPVLFCYISSISMKSITDDLEVVKIDFKEYKNG